MLVWGCVGLGCFVLVLFFVGFGVGWVVLVWLFGFCWFVLIKMGWVGLGWLCCFKLACFGLGCLVLVWFVCSLGWFVSVSKAGHVDVLMTAESLLVLSRFFSSALYVLFNML